MRAHGRQLVPNTVCSPLYTRECQLRSEGSVAMAFSHHFLRRGCGPGNPEAPQARVSNTCAGVLLSTRKRNPLSAGPGSIDSRDGMDERGTAQGAQAELAGTASEAACVSAG